MRGARVIRTERMHRAVSHSRAEVFARRQMSAQERSLSGASCTAIPSPARLHNWVISLETGKALGADEGQVRTIPLKVENGTISVSAEIVQGANMGRVA